MGINPWKGARISTVPLDFAVTLQSRGRIAGSYFRVAPSEDDVEDALKIDAQRTELPEGKVPLFYIEDFQIGDDGGIPLYFRKDQLLAAWKKEQVKKSNDRKTTAAPQVKVTELFSVLTKMVNDYDKDDDLSKLILVPPGDSAAKARLCRKNGGNEEPFRLGERIVVL